MGGLLVHHHNFLSTLGPSKEGFEENAQAESNELLKLKLVETSSVLSNLCDAGLKSACKIDNDNLNEFSKPDPLLDDCTISKVCFIDLDDTLIPTEWIRRRQVILKACTPNDRNIFKTIRDEIDLQTCCKLCPTIIDLINETKRIANTVAIVTNARSDKWINTFKSMFPEILESLDNEGIEIIRSRPKDIEPTDTSSMQYFKFWVDAKKEKFADILKRHSTELQNSALNQLDVISIGDKEFEEEATLELLQNKENFIRFAKIIKCTSGLNPENFLLQLFSILQAVKEINDYNTPGTLHNYGENVTYRIEGIDADSPDLAFLI